MVKEDIDQASFYSPVGGRICRWWKNLEKFGFEVSVVDFEDRAVDVEVEHGGNDRLCVGDPFEKGMDESIVSFYSSVLGTFLSWREN
jgi:hypothetical protein